MTIGIDVSQLVYGNTGVANYLGNLVRELVEKDRENEYVLFFSSLRRKFPVSSFEFPINSRDVKIKKYKFPPIFLDMIWNKLHILPIETFIGDVDIFLTSDWTEPPAKRAKKATILYDLIIYKHPEETHSQIIKTQKRKFAWVKKESDVIFCISNSTAKDAEEILGIDKSRLRVIYPGIK